ncbi:TlyA family RNA methyltransferase [Spiroplasma endosymbiont of Stenodema calcarata]|uniref:TlyA family RNA methyltransferase n=1 Tax=Spiroplasma endosymbiont of Stenodema calcarata TaxID=3139328 RepID=UPI003CCB15DB
MKIRLDQLLVNDNLAPSREKAKAMILANNVLVNDVPALKAGELVSPDSIITLRGQPLPYVSRAGEKLAKGLVTFNLKVDNLICLDIGSSTGGFTDCLLQNKAQKVYALDVGTNQLVWKLRNNPQVVSLEKTNFRYATKELFEPDQIEFACCDVSFISLDKIIPPLKDILLLDHYAFCLIKPQFESTKELVNKGKITNKETHQIVIKKIINLALINGFSVIKIDYSPILGNKKKNIEFICLLQRTTTPTNHFSDVKVMEIVENAWNSLLS